MAPKGWANSSSQYLAARFAAGTSKLSVTQARLSQSLYVLKEIGVHLPDLHAPTTELGFGLRQ